MTTAPNLQRKIFIIGYKNSGKTTFGKYLSSILGLSFIDLDEYIEQKQGKSIIELYSELGETNFRQAEWKALQDTRLWTDIVIATGGGAPCNCNNMEFMEKTGVVIYLKVSDETLLSRLEKASKHRPIVKGKNSEELRKYLADLRFKCEHHYNRAHYTIDGDHPDVDDLIKWLAGN